jgi:hypothetical protein
MTSGVTIDATPSPTARDTRPTAARLWDVRARRIHDPARFPARRKLVPPMEAALLIVQRR